LGEKYATD